MMLRIIIEADLVKRWLVIRWIFYKIKRDVGAVYSWVCGFCIYGEYKYAAIVSTGEGEGVFDSWRWV